MYARFFDSQFSHLLISYLPWLHLINDTSTTFYPRINNIYFAFKLHFIVLQGYFLVASNLDNKLDFPFARIGNKKGKMCSFSSNLLLRIIQIVNIHNQVQKKCMRAIWISLSYHCYQLIIGLLILEFSSSINFHSSNDS